MKVAVVNNYSLAYDWHQVRKGLLPDQFLYGVNHLVAAGHQVTLIEPPNPWKFIQRLASKSPIPLGSLRKQWEILTKTSCDVVYAPCQTELHLLAYWAGATGSGPPLVSLIHHPLLSGRLAPIRRPFVRMAGRGSAAMPALSARVCDEIEQVAPSKSVVIPWGPQADYYLPSNGPGNGFVAAGHTGRDFTTFVLACGEARVRAEVICPIEMIPLVDPLPHTVKLTRTPVGGLLPHSEVASKMQSARAVAVPMHRQNWLCGLSGLIDALGLGKPVVITRNKYIDLDVEAAGVGFWVDPGDVLGWEAALTRLDRDPDLAVEMGRRGRRLVEEGFNSDAFGRRIASLIKHVSGR